MRKLAALHEQSHADWRQLREVWKTSKEQWSDLVSQRFERDHWLPLTNQMELTLKEMEEMLKDIQNARRHID